MSFWAGIAISFLSAIGFVVARLKGILPKRESILGPSWVKSFIIILSLVAYAFFLELLGFLLCTFFFMFILLRILEPLKWKAVCAGAFCTAMASYVVFHVWLKTQLPLGILKHLLY